jgi:hypothetical protein
LLLGVELHLGGFVAGPGEGLGLNDISAQDAAKAP